VLQLLIGDGPVGAPLTADPRIAGVCFTGSLEVARLIEQQIAATAEPDAMLIAETAAQRHDRRFNCAARTGRA